MRYVVSKDAWINLGSSLTTNRNAQRAAEAGREKRRAERRALRAKRRADGFEVVSSSSSSEEEEEGDEESAAGGTAKGHSDERPRFVTVRLLWPQPPPHPILTTHEHPPASPPHSSRGC